MKRREVGLPAQAQRRAQPRHLEQQAPVPVWWPDRRQSSAALGTSARRRTQRGFRIAAPWFCRALTPVSKPPGLWGCSCTVHCHGGRCLQSLPRTKAGPAPTHPSVGLQQPVADSGSGRHMHLHSWRLCWLRAFPRQLPDNNIGEDVHSRICKASSSNVNDKVTDLHIQDGVVARRVLEARNIPQGSALTESRFKANIASAPRFKSMRRHAMAKKHELPRLWTALMGGRTWTSPTPEVALAAMAAAAGWAPPRLASASSSSLAPWTPSVVYAIMRPHPSLRRRLLQRLRLRMQP